MRSPEDGVELFYSSLKTAFGAVATEHLFDSQVVWAPMSTAANSDHSQKMATSHWVNLRAEGAKMSIRASSSKFSSSGAVEGGSKITHNPFFPYVPNFWNFDEWAPVGIRYTAKHKVPMLRSAEVELASARLVAYDKRRQSADAADTIVHFYISDERFKRTLEDPTGCADDLAKFRAVIGPDFSPYSTHQAELRYSSIWYAKAVTAYWQYRGLRVMPNVRWTSHGDIFVVVDGLPSGSTLSVSTLGVTKSKEQISLFRRGLEQLVTSAEPKRLIVHGRDRGELFDTVRDKTSLTFFQTQIDAAYEARR